MIQKTTIFIFSVVFILGSAYGLYQLSRYINKTTPPDNPALLRQAILSSLTNPYPDADTVVLETMWGFCGTTVGFFPDLPIVFYTALDEPENITSLSQQFGQTIIPQETFSLLTDSILKAKYNEEYAQNIWDSLTQHIVHMTVHAQKINNDHVKVYETYNLRNEYRSFEKDFRNTEEEWGYSLVDTGISQRR